MRLALMVVFIWAHPLLAWSQAGAFLKEEEAPRAVFPEATDFERKLIPSTPELKKKIQERMGKNHTSFWEERYVSFVAKKSGAILGYAVVVEEIGKHRPITFIVGAGPDGKVKDVALMAYREAYGGEVREKRFLAQYPGKDLQAPLLPYRDIQNITGATLSVEAIGRGAKKALALIEAVYLHPEGEK